MTTEPGIAELRQRVALGGNIRAHRRGHDQVRGTVIRVVLVEKAAHHQVLTYVLGDPTHWSSYEEALTKRPTVWAEKQPLALWDYLTRSLPSGR